MARYFVVVEGTIPGHLYIVGEVARERIDDGSKRELSLAANLAGESATIWTREELEARSVGRIALRRWETGNDTEFEFDNAVLTLGVTRTPIPGGVSALDLDLRGMTVQERAKALRMRAIELVEENRLGVERLRETIEEHREIRQRWMGATAGKQAKRAGRRRHLRSVS